MIKLKTLVEAIHSSINQAVQAVGNQSIEQIKYFFEEIPSPLSKEHEAAEKKIKQARQALAEGKTDVAKSLLQEIKDSNHQKVLAPEQEMTHRPKMVAMAYPGNTESGLETFVAHVPLISLVPMAASQVKHIKFRCDLEVTSNEDDELLVSFPSAGSEASSNSANTHIEIIVEGGETTDGLKKLIEGYDRVLRAQIPG
ncbi:DUF2589 domain-containing protein [Endozoicomonas lisbonensis]|uniref:Sulfite reductase alpha subunit-like flavoprotein n=1 Tax=Endozoicomonas lisbonensis TaxID=3120522 RepID=A0ABV2SAN7_9GAMM